MFETRLCACQISSLCQRRQWRKWPKKYSISRPIAGDGRGFTGRPDEIQSHRYNENGILAKRIPSVWFVDSLENQALLLSLRRPFINPSAVRAEPSSSMVLPPSGTVAGPSSADHSSNPASAPVPITLE